MRKLIDIPNTDGASSDYPSGRIRNKDNTVAPPVVGTPIVEELYGDIVQFFQRLKTIAGITENELPDNVTNGYQLVDALLSVVNGGMRVKFVNIGDWNMDTTPSVNLTTVNLGISDLLKIRDVRCMIRSDADYGGVVGVTPYDSLEKAGSIEIRPWSGLVILNRVLSSIFDNAEYTDTSYNRGWLVIHYLP